MSEPRPLSAKELEPMPANEIDALEKSLKEHPDDEFTINTVNPLVLAIRELEAELEKAWARGVQVWEALDREQNRLDGLWQACRNWMRFYRARGFQLWNGFSQYVADNGAQAERIAELKAEGKDAPSGEALDSIIQKIIEDLEEDMNDRRGIKLSNLDEATQTEIKQAWLAVLHHRLHEAKETT